MLLNTDNFSKKEIIDIFRNNNFNCFPVPKWPQSEKQQKKADSRYKGAETALNQPISDDENYGYMARVGCGNATIDLDVKERYGKFAEHLIKLGYLVIETPHGWHIPVIGMSGKITKIELFDYGLRDKKTIEIQGPKHYCIGPGSEIFDHDKQEFVKYHNRGSLKIWNANGKDFHKVIEEICIQCNVEGCKKPRSSNHNLRKRFLDRKIPTKGTSNDYFFQAALQCNNDGLTQNEAIESIQIIYDQWANSDTFSNRPWSNIETKIADVYDNNRILREGRPRGSSIGINRTEIAQKILTTREIYSDVESHDIYENKNGFLELINNTLKKELFQMHPEIEKADQDMILFKLESGGLPIPSTNKDEIVFKNGKINTMTRQFVNTDSIADMGFNQYDFLDKSTENEPVKFMKILYEHVPSDQHYRINAGLRAIFRNRVDSKISIIYGKSGAGKSTPLNILCEILGMNYSINVNLDDFLTDRATRAKIAGKRLLNINDIPEEWRDFTTLKTITGERRLNIRGFQKDAKVTENKLKIWASGNYLPVIKESEKDAMYSRRLSLIHNIKKERHKEDNTFTEKIIDEESEKIISWIINLSDEDCKYENSETVKREWEEIASPEIKFISDHYDISNTCEDVSVMRIIDAFKEKTNKNIEIKNMVKSLRAQGFVVKNNIVVNLVRKKNNFTGKGQMIL